MDDLGKVFLQVKKILSGPEWLGYLPEDFLRSALTAREKVRVCASVPIGKILLARFAGEECREAQFLPKGEELSLRQRACTPHYSMLQGDRVRLGALPPDSEVEIVLVESVAANRPGAVEFFTDLMDRARQRFSQLGEEGEPISSVYEDCLKPALRSFTKQSGMQIQELQEVLAWLAVAKKEPVSLTCIRQCMKFLAMIGRECYWAERQNVSADGLLDMPGLGRSILVFCIEHEGAAHER